MSCPHNEVFVPVRGASEGGVGEEVVVCARCGGFQRALPASFVMHGPVDPHAFPWSGTAIDAAALAALPPGARLDVLGAVTTDLREAHAIAFDAARRAAHARRDMAWFLNHGLVPTFLLAVECPDVAPVRGVVRTWRI
jgi:hypothetical protein